MAFGLSGGHDFCGFSIEEESLCEAQSCRGALCRRVKIFAFLWLAGVERFKEGGSLKSQEVVVGMDGY